MSDHDPRLRLHVEVLEAALEASGLGLAGSCDLASSLLCAGADDKEAMWIVNGAFADEEHTWVEWGDLILDPTSRQFDGDLPLVRERREDGPYQERSRQRARPDDLARLVAQLEREDPERARQLRIAAALTASVTPLSPAPARTKSGEGLRT